MPIINRDTLVDRPTAIEPVIGKDSGDEDDDESVEETEDLEVFGEGGGKTVHGVEFEEEDADVIKASNLVAMLATGSDEPDEVFRDAFKNSAIQLRHVKESGQEITEISETADRLNASSIGVVWDETSSDGNEDNADTVEEQTLETEEDQSEE